MNYCKLLHFGICFDSNYMNQSISWFSIYIDSKGSFTASKSNLPVSSEASSHLTLSLS